ncbi:O-antigen ligase family protein [Paenibacillus timonensis]|uniref:O-antigen ligase family protein n=2 Tax=Paenibacillus timonensis TaxID=225915 RepID=A0ABW3SBA0_9BACL|nr:O-antigen ligase family protein [Paenibacillus timonensis]MCH1640249.1 O-antigen ligase family protein [Paenibacillus timonensis]
MMAEISLLWIALLVAAAVFFTLQCLLSLKMKVDAAYLFAFCIYFDFFAYFYKLAVPGESLILLIGAPLLPVGAALLLKPSIVLETLRDQGGWLWGIFLAYALISLTWAPSESNGLMKEVILLAHGVIPALYVYLVYRKYGRFSWTVVAWAGFAYALLHLLMGVYNEEYPGRLTLPGGNPIFNARTSLITVTVCLWAPRIPLPVRLLSLGVALTSALATQSRGPLAAFLLANALYFGVWFIRKFRERTLGKLSRLAVPLLFLLIVAGGTASAYAEQLATWVENSRFMVLFDRNQLQGDDNYIGRLDLQTRALEKLEASPFLGAGLGSVTPPLARDFPHNLVLEIAAEGGFAGLTLWTFALLFSLWAAYQRTPVLAILLVQTVGYALASGDFGYNYEYMVMAMTALALMPVKQREGVGIKREALVFDHRI